MTDEQIRALTFYQRSPLFDDREKAVILYADRVTRSAAVIRDAALEDLRKHFNEEQIVELGGGGPAGAQEARPLSRGRARVTCRRRKNDPNERKPAPYSSSRAVGCCRPQLVADGRQLKKV